MSGQKMNLSGIPAAEWKKMNASVKKQFQASGWSAYKLSQESGVSESIISRWLGGKRELSVRSLYLLAHALGIGPHPDADPRDVAAQATALKAELERARTELAANQEKLAKLEAELARRDKKGQE